MKEGKVSRKNDSEISGSQDIHCDTHGEVGGVTPEHSLGHTGRGFYGNCCFSPVSGVSLNLNLALQGRWLQVTASGGIWKWSFGHGVLCCFWALNTWGDRGRWQKRVGDVD